MRIPGYTIRYVVRWVALAACGAPAAAMLQAQDTAVAFRATRTYAVRRYTFSAYIQGVERTNLDLAAERLSVDIARAQVTQARLFPNPALGYGLSSDVTGQHLPTSFTLSLGQTFLLGGKRGARIEVASSQREAATAQLSDAIRTTRAAAANAYFDALLAEEIYERKRQTSENLDRLVTLNEHRLEAGDIGEVDVVQSRVEALQFRSDLLAAANDVQNTRLAMTLLLGPNRPRDQTIAQLDSVAAPALVEDASISPPNVDSLVTMAIARRPDLAAARAQRDAALRGIRVARANRVPDLDFAVGVAFNSASTNPIAPSPTFQALNLSLGVPLLVSNLVNRGELEATQYVAQQSEQTVRSAEWRAAIEVRQNFARVEAAAARAKQYNEQVIGDAERVRSAKLYSYQRGSATLLEVISSERTVSEVYLASLDALNEYRRALVALAEASGDWELLNRS